jgi:hypothetical protein
MTSKMQNLIIRIATKAIEVKNDELYNVVDDFYLKRIDTLPLWAKNKLENMQ